MFLNSDQKYHPAADQPKPIDRPDLLDPIHLVAHLPVRGTCSHRNSEIERTGFALKNEIV